MKTQFTSGTWQFNGQTDIKTPIQYQNLNGEIKQGFVHIANVSHLMNKEEAQANAQLIAAAPDLYKVCTDLLNAFVHVENDVKGNQARTNIFKYCPEFRNIATAARIAIEKTDLTPALKGARTAQHALSTEGSL